MNNDIISRQAAIDVIRQEVIVCKLSLESPFLNNQEKKDLQSRKSQAIENIVAIERLPSAERWTSVTDGLPEIGDRVLVTIPSIGETFVTIGTYAGEYTWHISDYGLCGKVIAWSPLPSPYKGGE